MSDLLDVFQRDDRCLYVVPAVVTDNKDPENMGRIKVKFPFDDNETGWVRVAVPMAGDGRGFFFFPEVNDEVLVAFLYGDLNQPVVLGFLWNGKDKPPQNDPSTREIKTVSGHRISLNDKEEKIQIQNKKGDQISIEKDSIINIKTDGCQLQMDGIKKEIKIKGDVSVKIEGNNIELKGTNVTVKADAVLTIKGGVVRIN
ncbi:MAG TPA: phage baseplate assembly protein V [Persephonella sp.]|nr:phage baseplate assembly protein V [Persephonella sp.]